MERYAVKTPVLGTQKTKSTVKLGKQKLTIEDIINIAYRHYNVSISHDPDFIKNIDAGAQFLETLPTL